MRSIKVRYAALSAAILAALGLALAAIFLPGKPAQAQSPVQSADYQQQEPVPPYRYIMKEYQGKIAIYSSLDQQRPQYVTDFDTLALPTYDRQMLGAGHWPAHRRGAPDAVGGLEQLTHRLPQ